MKKRTSFPRRRESSTTRIFWTPAFAGATALFLFCLLPFRLSWARSDTYGAYVRGLLAEKSGDITTALQEYEKVVEMDPQALEVYKDIAQLNLRVGHTEAALRAAEKVKELAPRDPSSFLFLGNVHMARGDVAQAVKDYQDALELDPDNLRALENLGDYYFTVDPAQALAYYRQYLTHDPNDAEIHFRMGLLHQKRGEMSKAIDAYNASIKLDSKQAAPHFALAEYYELQKDTAAAIGEYEICTQLEPTNPAIFMRLGHLYYETQKWEDSASRFQSARALVPTEPSIYYWLARLAEERKQWPEAYSYAEKAYQLSRDNQFLPLMAYYLTLEGKVSDAVSCLEKARRVEPDSSNVLLFLGMGYLDLNKLSKAVEVLEYGCKIHPREPALHFQLGIAYDRSGRFEAAMEQFQMVLRLDTRNSAAMNYMGYSFAEHSLHLPEAEELVRKALELEPSNGAFLDSLGWIRFKRGSYPDAEDYLTRAVKDYPDALIYEHLGDVCWADKKPEKALGAWAKSLALDSHRDAVRKKIDEAAHGVIQGTDQRKYLKYIQGNFRQIRQLQGSVRLQGRWKGESVNSQGRFSYQKPDRLDLDLSGASTDTLKAASGNGLNWLSQYFSGNALDPLDDPQVKTTVQGDLLHFEGAGREAWVDWHKGILTRLKQPHTGGGTDLIEFDSYTLTEGLWLPGEIQVKNEQIPFKIRLEPSQWQINEL